MGIEPTTSGLDLPSLCWLSYKVAQRKSGTIKSSPAAKISPGSFFESHQDSRREAKIWAAKISAQSCREAHQDSRWEAVNNPGS